MDNNLRNEMLIVMNNESVCGDCQVKILSICTKFVNHQQYMSKIGEAFELLLNNERGIDNFWVIFPQLINIIIQINKDVLVGDILQDGFDIDYMKFVLYAVVYSYLDNHKSILLNSLSQGDLRIGFINIIGNLLIKPKKLKINRQSLLQKLISCICDDDNTILL